MATVQHSAVIATDADFLFEYSQRQSCRLAWDPFVASVALHDGGDMPQRGTEVTVRTWNRLTMTCEYVQFQRPSCIAIRMLRGPSFLRVFGGTWRFEPLSRNSNRTTFSYSFEIKPMLGAALISRAARLYFSWDMKRRLHALRRGAEAAFLRYESTQELPWAQPA